MRCPLESISSRMRIGKRSAACPPRRWTNELLKTADSWCMQATSNQGIWRSRGGLRLEVITADMIWRLAWRIFLARYDITSQTPVLWHASSSYFFISQSKGIKSCPIFGDNLTGELDRIMFLLRRKQKQSLICYYNIASAVAPTSSHHDIRCPRG